MNLSAVPYLLVSREVPLSFGPERVFVCLCLLDHMVLGIGHDRDAAMGAMMRELEAKYGESEGLNGLETDGIDLN